MKRLKICIILIVFSTACEEQVDVPLRSQNSGLLVVEAVLTNENKNQLVRLSLPYSKPNGEREPATGADLFIFEDTTAFRLVEFPLGSGNYYSTVRRAVFGKLYTLVIRYEGKQYFARDSAVPVEPLGELNYSQGAKGYSLILDSNGKDPNYIEHTISWKNTGACLAGDPCEGRIVHYDLKTIDVHESFKPDKIPFYFPRGARVIRKKYSVSPAYKTFLRSMLSETEWRGGLFDIQRADVPTNLSEGAVGFFAVCSVVSDTTVIE